MSAARSTGRRIAAPGHRVAITGTPGTGKSSVARGLPASWQAVEVGDLAVRLGAGTRRASDVLVDLPKLGRALRRSSMGERLVLVGHLAHLLPVREVVVLRCDPRELGRRLGASRRGSPSDRQENVAAEATDVILLEAIRPGRRIWEVDTTGRRPPDVAREVASLLRRRPPSRYGSIDWLADSDVTDYLLGPAR
jgi:adenylate kinase